MALGVLLLNPGYISWGLLFGFRFRRNVQLGHFPDYFKEVRLEWVEQ